MKRILATALLLCSTAHAQQPPEVARQPSAPTAAADPVHDGLQQLAHIPWTSDEDIKRSAFGVPTGQNGIAPEGEIPTVRNQIFQNYRGAGIFTKAGDGRIIDCISRHNYVGARLASSDSEIRGCRLYNNRDACLWIARDAGNCQSTQNHCYGARIACYNAGGAWYRAVQDTYADALIGYWGDGGESVLTNVLFQHNTVRDALLRGGDQHMVNCIVKVQREVKTGQTFSVPGMQVYARKVGVELGGECSLRGGLVQLTGWKHPLNEFSGQPAEAIWVTGDGCVIDTHLIDGDGIDGSIGIRTKGARRNLRVDCIADGFQQPNERILVVDDAAHTNGLDITLRINGAVKPIRGYIDIGAGWTGSIRLIDTANGKTMSLPQGEGSK
jgi:hypothetical protein